MSITENRLRRIIRSLIKESLPMAPGKRRRRIKYDLNQIMELIDLETIEFTYERASDDIDPYYDFVLRVDIRNPYTEQLQTIEGRSSTAFALDFDSVNEEYKNNYTEAFKNNLVLSLFKNIYKVIYPGDFPRSDFHGGRRKTGIYKKHETEINSLCNLIINKLDEGKSGSFIKYFSDLLDEAHK